MSDPLDPPDQLNPLDPSNAADSSHSIEPGDSTDSALLSEPATQQVSDDGLGMTRAVLFDLDGTLADTAPDLAAAANKMRSSRGLELIPFERLRPLASAGARGLIGGAFGIAPDHPDYAALRDEFLRNYEEDLCIETTLFPGIDAMLADLSERGIRWGIVTNKVTRLAEPLVAQLGLGNADCVVCGDTTPHSKPHPAPLLHAADLMGIDAAHIVYIGDDMRDVLAGRSANMMTIVAGYGYCGNAQPPTEWGADLVAESTEELAALLRALP